MEEVMKKVNWFNSLGLAGILVFLLVLSGCDSPTGSNNDNPPTEEEPTADEPTADEPTADELADDALNNLETLMNDIDMSGFDPSQGAEGVLSSADLENMEESFQAVIDADPANAVGNMGMAMTTLASVAYRDSVAAAVDFINEAMGVETESSTSSSEVHAQVASGPQMIQALSTVSAVPEDWNTIGEVQDELNAILQVVDESIVYMNTAIDGIGSDTIQITVSGDTVVLDKADLYIFRVAVRNLQIPLAMSIVYDLRLFTESGEFTVTSDTTDSELQEAVIYSLENTSFLTRRTGGPTLADIRTAMKAGMDDAVAAYNGMMAREGDQTQYLIPNDELEIPSEFYTEIESGFAEAGVHVDLASVADIRDLIEDILDGEPTLTAEIGGTDYTINLGNLFDTTEGLREWLPTEFIVALISQGELPKAWSFPDPSFDGVVIPDLSEDDVNSMLQMMMEG
jgi:hypothetical protein